MVVASLEILQPVAARRRGDTSPPNRWRLCSAGTCVGAPPPPSSIRWDRC